MQTMVILLSAMIYDCAAKNIPTFAGPYILNLRRFEICPSDDSIVFHVKHGRFNPSKPFERTSIAINLTTKTAWTDSFWANSNWAIRANNEWKPNSFIFNFPGGACSMVREHIPALFNIMTESMPELRDKKTPCVYPPGQYEFQNRSVFWEFPRFKILPYGHYLFTYTSGLGTRVKKLCIQVECEIIPKPY